MEAFCGRVEVCESIGIAGGQVRRKRDPERLI
jgi:hypothetical protein